MKCRPEGDNQGATSKLLYCDKKPWCISVYITSINSVYICDCSLVTGPQLWSTPSSYTPCLTPTCLTPTCTTQDQRPHRHWQCVMSHHCCDVKHTSRGSSSISAATWGCRRELRGRWQCHTLYLSLSTWWWLYDLLWQMRVCIDM